MATPSDDRPPDYANPLAVDSGADAYSVSPGAAVSPGECDRDGAAAAQPLHRRALRTAVVAGAVALGLIVGVVLATNGSGHEADTELTGRESSAGRSVGDGGSPATPSDPTVDILAEQLDGTGALQVSVADSEAPTAPGATTQLCVLVTYDAAGGSGGDGDRELQTFGCAPSGGNSELALDPSAPTIACAAVEDRQTVLSDGTAEAAAGFKVVPSEPLQAGSFEVTVEATTGYGDGCPPADARTDHAATATLDLDVG